MIDVSQEKILPFPALAAELPSRRMNRPVSVSTIHRWRKNGVAGIHLEAIRVGGAWHTSWEAFQRFCEQLTALDRDSTDDGETPGEHLRDEAAGQLLDAIGI